MRKLENAINKWKTNIKSEFWKKFLDNNYAVAITSMIVISFVVLLTSHTVNTSRINAYQAYLHDCDTEAIGVYYEDECIGIIRSNDVIQDIFSELKNELEEKYSVEIAIHDVLKYVETHAEEDELVNKNTLYRRVKSILDFGVVAYGIEVDGENLGVLESKVEAEKILEDIKKPYVEKLEREDADIKSVNFVQSVKIVDVDTDFSKLSEPDQLLKYLQRGTDEEKIHIVDEGDSFWSISDDYNLTVDDLIVANPGVDASLIHPGDEISLIMPKPYISVETSAKIILEDKMEYETEYEYVSYLYNDEYRVKKKGVYGEAEVEAIVIERDGIEVDKKILSEKVVSEPETRIILQGTKEPPPKKGTGYFINPLPVGTVTSRFGPRWGSFHHGLDIASAEGTPIKAADGGTVTFAGWSGDYGYMIEIDHGGGFKTRYAHCSKLYVSVGEKVYQNKTIALVGHTGYTVGTTGNHVHFEVRKYGTTVNPQSYIGSQYR